MVESFTKFSALISAEEIKASKSTILHNLGEMKLQTIKAAAEMRASREEKEHRAKELKDLLRDCRTAILTSSCLRNLELLCASSEQPRGTC